jgi:hypothetical protein
VPIQTRCPSCSAAIPTNAAWCSLCHSDLRPRPAPRPAAPAAPVTIIVAPVHGTVLEDTRPTGIPSDADLELALGSALDEEPVPVGRHSRDAPTPVPTPTATPTALRPSRALPSRGKHAGSGRRTPSRPRAAALDLGDLELPAPGDATPEQVDQLADQMLSHLAVSEPQPRLLDPDDFPGGRWGFAGAGLVTILVVLLVLYTVAGVILG